MNVKKFLDQEETKELIAKGALEEVYRRYNSLGGLCGFLSSYLLDLGINPLEYFEKAIPDDAFYGSMELAASVVIPNNITTIGNGAFNSCYNLVKVAFEANSQLTCIEKWAFGLCNSLENIDFPKGLTRIGNYAFDACIELTDIIIPDSVLTINNGAFIYCTGLTSVTIGNGVTAIGAQAFADCSNLKAIQYMGTKAEWEKISKDPDWRARSPIDITHCIDGDVWLNR